MNYREVSKKLAALGCVEIPRRGGGSHRKWINPETNRGTVIPDWGNRDLKLGTVRAVIKQLALDWERFRNI